MVEYGFKIYAFLYEHFMRINISLSALPVVDSIPNKKKKPTGCAYRRVLHGFFAPASEQYRRTHTKKPSLGSAAASAATLRSYAVIPRWG